MHEDKLGQRVRVTNERSPIGGAWKGRLIGLAHDPSLIVDADDGHRLVLPQSFTVEETEPLSLAAEICPTTPLDLGIVRAVKILQDAGVHTYESCEGGQGHSYAEPTIRFYGSHGEGWRALAVCMDHGLPVMHLQRSWDLDNGEPSGPYWQLVFYPTVTEREDTSWHV